MAEMQIPKLYSQETCEDPIVCYKLELVGFPWQWFIIEGEKQDSGDILFFGYVKGFADELGYFTFAELKATKLPMIVTKINKPLSKIK